MSAYNTEKLGSIIAFEGQPDIVSTQLRLLPTSPHILLLPSLQHYSPACDPDQQNFDPQTFITSVHHALEQRHDAASAFLQSASPTSKRLVFLDGGAAGAHSLCIKAFMKHETDGDAGRAEAIFNHFAKHGCVPVLKPRRKLEATRLVREAPRDDDAFQDPITRAMRAADALDRQTASLQPSNELDLTLTSRSRSSSLPLYGYSDQVGDATPFVAYGLNPTDQAPSEGCSTPMFAITNYGNPTESSNQTSSASVRSPTPSSQSTIGGNSRFLSSQATEDLDRPSPTSDVFSIRTVDNVVFGEASLLDMRMSARQSSLTRVKSLDRLYPANSKFRDLCLPSSSQETITSVADHSRPQTAREATFEDAKGRRASVERPRTVTVRASRSTINLAPVPENKKRKTRSTKSEDDAKEKIAATSDTPCEPVLSRRDDLIVYFKSSDNDKILASMINAFKSGKYPVVLQRSPTPDMGDSGSHPETPKSDSSSAPETPTQASTDQAMAPSNADDEYDPFAYTQVFSSPKTKQAVPQVTLLRPPTPAQTPPPCAAETSDNVHEFNVALNDTAVTTQNNLRSVLNKYFPSETEAYHQFQFPLLPELRGLWQPIFRETDPAGSTGDNVKVDHILAIGCQKGVNKEYSDKITKQLDRHGSNVKGLGRSGRLDFRYLLANAMQSYATQPFSALACDSPFTNSYILATLIVPHLETYLALHTGIKYLLLEYPPVHLPTVIALQKLIGSSLMQVAQIINSDDQESMPFTQVRGSYISNYSDGTFGKPGSPSPRNSFDMFNTKTNLLLSSTATNSEIAKFVSAVWDIPVDTSGTNTPDEPERPAESGKLERKKMKPAPLQSVLSPFPKDVGPQSPLSPTAVPRSMPLETIRSTTIEVPSPSPSLPLASFETKTSKSRKGWRSRSKSRTRQADTAQADTASIASYDPSEDSDYDVEERRLMPMFLHKPKVAKGGSRKALRFLGLA